MEGRRWRIAWLVRLAVASSSAIRRLLGLVALLREAAERWR
jgi:hypothetical protein